MDVEARSGFLLRHNREFCGRPEVATGRAMAAALAGHGVTASPTDVSNWERGTIPAPSGVIEAYEAITGAAPGSLRGIVETMRRCYHAVRVPQRRRDQHDLGLDEITERCRVVLRGRPRGIDWLRFADLLIGERVVLPAFLVEEPVARLVSETNRSVGVAYLNRYEALASILDSPYTGIAEDAVRAAVFDEHAQVLLDAITVLSESPEPDRIRWLATLLRHPRPLIARGAAFAVDNALETGRLDDMTLDVVSTNVLVAYLESTLPRNRHAMESVIRSLPRRRLAALLDQLDAGRRAEIQRIDRPPTAAQRADGLAIAEGLRRAVTTAAGPQPLLRRLLYELIFEERATRRFHAASVLKAVPYRDDIAAAIAAIAETHPDPAVRRGATEAVTKLGRVGSVDTVNAMVCSAEDEVRRAGLIASAHCQLPVAEDLLLPLCRDDHPQRRLALYAAGMNGSPLIDRLADDPAAGPRVRGGARWWRREGRAVLD